MPRVIKLGGPTGGRGGDGQWRIASFNPDDAASDEFQFMSCFEEFVYDGDAQKKGDNAQEKGDDAVDQASTKSKKSKSKLRRKKKDAVDHADDENEETVTQDVAEEPVAKKRKKTKVKKSAGRQVDDTKEVADDTEEVANDTKEVANGDDGEEKKAVTDMGAWSMFDLRSPLLQAIAEMGFSNPTQIQCEAIPPALHQRLDILGSAETGSGKTLAYGIPAVTRILEALEEEGAAADDAMDGLGDEEFPPDRSRRSLLGLVLCPTRELAVQVTNHLGRLLKYTPIKIMHILGGLSQQKQERLLLRRPDILVATPGRLAAIVASGVGHGSYFDWSKLRALVIDEADRMTEKGHFRQLRQLLELIDGASAPNLQRLVFSATLSSGDRQRWGLNEKRVREVDCTKKNDRLTESRMPVQSLLHKDTALVYLLHRHPGRTLVFTNSIDSARRLYKILSLLKLQPLLLHAQMKQPQRLRNLERFAQSDRSVLLATDVAARGLDIVGIQHVIHYQVPRSAELYVHRSGRTARAEATGLSVLLIDPIDAPVYIRLCKALGKPTDLPVFAIDADLLYEVISDRVTCTTRLEAAQHRKNKISARESWFERAAREADIELDEDLKPKRKEGTIEATETQVLQLHREVRALESELRSMLAQPLPDALRSVIPSTRYISSDLVADYENALADDALVAMDASRKRQEERKKLASNLRIRAAGRPALEQRRRAKMQSGKRKKHKS